LDSLDLKEPENATTSQASTGRGLALDLGTKRVGVAVSDELRITVNPLPPIERRSWKDLLRRVIAIIESYDARGLVIGLPLRLDGAEGPAAGDARALAENFQRSLSIPVYLQDERLTTFAAATQLKTAGRSDQQIESEVDSEAAALILRDFFADEK
jgi:putative Holliday junction resolvase